MALAIKTNLTPEFVHEALLETFQKWLNFSMGIGKLGGKRLKAPSGRMAAALRAEFDREGNVVALWVDPQEDGADINDYLRYGHKEFSIKRRMLAPGRPGVKRTNDGRYFYRVIPIRNTPKSPKTAFAESSIKNLLTKREMPQGGVIGINKNLARMWAANYDRASSGSVKLRTMSSRPGTARWVIPRMPVYNIGKLLKDTLPPKLKDRVVL